MANKNQAPDMRVRLTAEGLQDVVKAFQRIADEAKKKSAEAGGAMKFLNEQLGSLGKLFPTLAAGAAVAGFAAMTKKALETADNLGKLNQKTGITVQTLSTLSFAARTADLDQEQLASGLQKATRFFGEYDKGAQAARDAVKDLFGSEKALEGLSPVQRILKVVEALSRLAPGVKRTTAAMAIFGKAGSELLPLIDDLGSGGFDQLAAKAKRLGLSIDGDVAASAQAANDALTDLHSEAEGITLQFASGFAPALADIATALTAATTGDGVSGFKKLGEFASEVLKGIVTLCWAVVGGVLEIGAKTSSLIQNFGRGLGDLFTEGPRQAWENWKANMIADSDRIDKFIQDQNKQFILDITGETRANEAALKKAKGKGKTDTSVNDKATQDRLKAAEKIAKAQLALTEARLNNELTLVRAHNAAINDEETRRYQEGLTALDDYFKGRAARINAEFQKEYQILLSKLKAQEDALDAAETRTAPKGEDAGDRALRVAGLKKEVEATRTQIKEAKIKLDSALAANNDEQLRATRDLYRERLQAEADLATAEGDRWTAEQKNLEAQIAGVQRLKGESATDFTARKKALLDSGQQQIAFDKLQFDAAEALRSLAVARQAIEDRLALGKETTLTAEAKLKDLDKERLPLLQAIADAMTRAAVTPEQIQAARQLQDEVGQIAVASKKSAYGADQLAQAFENAIGQGLLEFLTQGIDQADSLADAFRNLGLTIVQSLRQAMAQMLVAWMMMNLMHSLLGIATGAAGAGGGGGGGGTGGGMGLMKVGGAASGGLITGPGTGTSDSIAARLSDGEFVMREAVVRRPGMLQLLTALNSGPRARSFSGFAEGGLVDAAAQGQGREAGLKAVLDIDPAIVLKRIEASPEWSRVVVRTTEANRKRMNSALGRNPQ